MYNKDFIERMEWIEDNLDKDGMLLYSEDSHDYYTIGYSDTCFFEEDIDYILDYLKETFQKRKGLYKIIWFDNTVGIVVGAKNVKEFIINLRESCREDDEGNFEALTHQIEREKKNLIDMYIRREEDSLITKQERYIKELVEQQKDYWKVCENDFKLFVYTEKIR